MGLDLSFLNPLAPLMDLGGGIVSANQARNAFKTRYQDTVKDMKKAGLNPALAYGQGGGNPQTVPLPQVGESVQKSVASSANAAQARANAELTEAQTNLLRAQTAELSRRPFLENLKLGAETGLIGAQTTGTGAQTDYTRMRTLGEQLENEARQARIDILAIDKMLRQLDADYASATLEDRVALAHKVTQQAGLNLTSTEIANTLARLGIPKAQAMGQGFQSLQDFQKWWGDQAETQAQDLENLSDGVKNWIAAGRRALARRGLGKDRGKFKNFGSGRGAGGSF